MTTIGFSGLAGIGGMLILPVLWMARRQLRSTSRVRLDATAL